VHKTAFIFIATMTAAVSADVSWGHFHFNARDLDAARKFWTMLGATPAKAIGANDVYRVQNAFVLVRKAEPTGGSEATRSIMSASVSRTSTPSWRV